MIKKCSGLTDSSYPDGVRLDGDVIKKKFSYVGFLSSGAKSARAKMRCRWRKSLGYSDLYKKICVARHEERMDGICLQLLFDCQT